MYIFIHVHVHVHVMYNVHVANVVDYAYFLSSSPLAAHTMYCTCTCTVHS